MNHTSRKRAQQYYNLLKPQNERGSVPRRAKNSFKTPMRSPSASPLSHTTPAVLYTKQVNATMGEKLLVN